MSGEPGSRKRGRALGRAPTSPSRYFLSSPLGGMRRAAPGLPVELSSRGPRPTPRVSRSRSPLALGDRSGVHAQARFGTPARRGNQRAPIGPRSSRSLVAAARSARGEKLASIAQACSGVRSGGPARRGPFIRRRFMRRLLPRNRDIARYFQGGPNRSAKARPSLGAAGSALLREAAAAERGGGLRATRRGADAYCRSLVALGAGRGRGCGGLRRAPFNTAPTAPAGHLSAVPV